MTITYLLGRGKNLLQLSQEWEPGPAWSSSRKEGQANKSRVCLCTLFWNDIPFIAVIILSN